MAYRSGNHYQIGLLPQSIEEYVADDDPVRAYDAFVEALDFHELGIEIEKGHAVGTYIFMSERTQELDEHHSFRLPVTIWV